MKIVTEQPYQYKKIKNENKSFLILHGLNGSPKEHWQYWLAEELHEMGHSVSFPTLPSSESPNLLYWLSLLHLEMQAAGPDVTVIAHSLGAYLWLQYASIAGAVRAERVLLVAPPGLNEIRATGRVRDLPDIELSPTRIHSTSKRTLLVASEADPYSRAGARQEYANPLGLEYVELPEWAAHINIESGFGEWPSVLQWALGAPNSVFLNTNTRYFKEPMLKSS